jgi:hypothetical protein
VLLGGRSPLLLRPQPDTEGFRLVGECYVHSFMHGETVLGPLPDSWQFGDYIIEVRRMAYADKSGNETLQDPRRGPLPPGWELWYKEGKERNENGDLSPFIIYNQGTDEATVFDPRLTKEALIERGIQLEEIVLV